MHRRAWFGGFFPLSISFLLSACATDTVDEPIAEQSSALTTAEVALTGPKHVSGKVGLPASLALRTAASGCLNHPGPRITLEGELVVAGLASKIILKNNVQGTHTASALADADVTLVSKDGIISLPKGGHDGVGGNPLIKLQLLDDYGAPIGDLIDLGRCNRLRPSSKVDFTMLSRVDFDVLTGDCQNSGGPHISLNGALILGGVHGKLIFSNNEKGTKSNTVDVMLEIEVLQKGQSIVFDKSPRFGNGAGGNPLVFIKLLDDAYNPISGELALGRCNKI